MGNDGFDSVPPDDVPRSPTGRVPKWVIDEAQGRITNIEPWRAASSGQTESLRRHERKRHFRKILPILVLLSIVGSSIWLSSGFAPNAAVNRVFRGLPTAPQVLRPSNFPTPSHEESSSPLGVPAPLAVTSNSYQFIGFQSDKKTPIAYDPCRPIHFVTRSQGEPLGGSQIIMDAVLQVTQATGLQFINDGATTETPSLKRASYQPGSYGDRWAPVLIAWATTAENPVFATDVDGEGGSTYVSEDNGPRIYVTGIVELDSAQLTKMLQFPDGYEKVRAVVLHELGHLVGLGHVNDANQLMFPEGGLGVTDFAPGDLTGLAMLGRGACAPNL